MRAAQLKDNVVINFAEVGGFDGAFIDPHDSVIGSIWNGVTFSHPAPPAPTVPVRVPMLNAHLVLIDAGWMDSVTAYINAIPGPDGAKARAYFSQALTMERTNPLVMGIPAALGKTEADIDTLFIAAGALHV